MRIERDIVVDATRKAVWELISDPARYPEFFASITRYDVAGEKERGLGARYSMRMRVGSADVGGVIEIVEFDEPGDMAWTSITGIDQRGRWRLREAGPGKTRVVLRLAYGAPGGLLGTISDWLGAPTVARNLERTLENLKAELEGAAVASQDGLNLPAKV